MRKLEEELDALAGSGMYPFHMPGHKRKGDGAFRTDITEIDGFDNLHDPRDLILEEMKFAADFYHVRDTFFLVNGSTCGILAAVSAAVKRGGRILIPRRSHISVYHAACLRDLEPVYIEEGGEEESPDAVVLTSPTYEGCVPDVGKWAAYAKKRGIPLIVDEAHGAHFSMHPYFPRSALELGADLVVQSTHKTLGSLTQTALLHNVSGKVDSRNLQKFLKVYESSSPSYVLLSSITSAIHACAEKSPDGTSCFDAYTERLGKLRRSLDMLRNLRLLGGADAVLKENADPDSFGEAGTVLDPGKIVILGGSRISGPALYDRLRLEFHLQPEMKAPGYVLLMTSVSDTDEGLERLRQALFEIDADLSTAEEHEESGDSFSDPSRTILPPVRLRPSQAWEGPSESVPLQEAAGRISADFVVVFPPDSPVLIPGEEITKKTAEQIRNLEALGLSVSGADGGRIRCVREP